MGNFRMATPVLKPIFEWPNQCYGMFSNGGTNVMACFRMAGGRTNVKACFRMAGGDLGFGLWGLGPRVWALGFRA